MRGVDEEPLIAVLQACFVAGRRTSKLQALPPLHCEFSEVLRSGIIVTAHVMFLLKSD